MFKIGDKITRVKEPHPGTEMTVGSEWIVTCVVSDRWIRVDGYHQILDGSNFELVEEIYFPLYSEEAAVKLLTERGYEVKAPPEPLKGKAYVYKCVSNEHIICLFHQWDEGEGIGYELIAIVDWTEGQGLNTSK